MSTRLKDLQSFLYRLITAPSGVGEGLAAERNLPRTGLGAIVLGDERLSAEERADIYANMYFYRLLDALKEDFPATLKVLGDDAFHNLATGYLLEYPPTEPSVAECGRFLSRYLREHDLHDRHQHDRAPGDDAPYLADLAGLERATVEVFQGPDADALSADAMRAIPAEQWPSLKLRLHPCVQVLDVEWHVADLLRAVEEGRDWQPAARGAAKILVSRQRTRVLYRELEQIEYRAIDVARTGATFANICELIAQDAGDLDEDAGALDPVAELNRLLARWLSDAIFTV